MKKQEYRPEGIMDKNDNLYLSSRAGLMRAMNEGKILQARCQMCDAEHSLHLKLGGINAVIPKEEAAIGIKEKTVKDVAIITRVNKMISFKVKSLLENNGEIVAYLSRREAQLECEKYIFSNYFPGDVINARVTHLEQFGAFVDIGCGIVSMISIDNISVSRIRHPSDRFTVGMEILAVVRELDKDNYRITLSHKELLGTWQQNACRFEAGQTVSGIVRSVESYGIFVELAPNLAGLAEYSEGIQAGQLAGVYIKSILPEKMKIKLAIVDTGEMAGPPAPPEYCLKAGHLDRWCYSPEGCARRIETVFDGVLSET